ncbi:hypothetical protein JW960_05055 [candidate division KSB1 bacterium]|nr:hypothetical protein [candidate division KSB1 bacterium]
MNNFEFFIPIVLFMCVAFIIKVISDNRVRKAAIDHGQINENIKYLYSQNWENAVPSSLKWGIVLIFMGLAFLLIQFVPDFDSDKLTAAILFIMAGLGFIAYYALGKYLYKVNELKKQNE